MVKYPDVFAGVLVGGRGRRLGGVDKARLRRPDGVTFIEHVLSSLGGVVGAVVLAGRAGQAFPEVGVPLRADRYPGAGPLAGLEALLAEPLAPWCWLVASDMPRFDAGILDVLAPARDEGRIVVPEAGGRLHPTCALYASSLVGEVRQRLAAGERALHALIEATPHARVCVRGPLEGALFNVNEPAELSDSNRGARG